jgi:hypothetical protein
MALLLLAQREWATEDAPNEERFYLKVERELDLPVLGSDYDERTGVVTEIDLRMDGVEFRVMLEDLGND